jgi:acetyltransferase-like isoleucine patch superfamily enzyme
MARPRDVPSNTHGGGWHYTALIGFAPESRDWKPGMPTWHPVISPGVRLEAYVTVDAGVYAPTFIGADSWLMKKVHVGHDAIIGRNCELAPGVVIGGHAILRADTKIGVNACVLPYVKVGRNCRIGAGAVVTKDVPDGEVWVGNPASPITKTKVCEASGCCGECVAAGASE